VCSQHSEDSRAGNLRATCIPEPLPSNPTSKPKCTNCRLRKATCNWGDAIPRQMNTIKISIYEGLPEESGDDDNDGYKETDYSDSGGVDESAPMSLGVPGMTSREDLLLATDEAMAWMCLEQEEDVDRLVDELEKCFASDSFT